MPDLLDSTSIVAVFGHPRAARLVARGLRALAHRGGEAAGIASASATLHVRREPTTTFLADEPALEALAGDVAVGVRHSRGRVAEAVRGLVESERAPAVGTVGGVSMAVALSGRFIGGAELRGKLASEGAVFRGDGDDELWLHLMARSGQKRVVNRVVDALWHAEASFAGVVIAPGLLVATRDPRGLRPLVLGQLDQGTVVATERAAITAMGGAVLRSLAPGEMWVVDVRGAEPVRPFQRRTPSPCAQEALQLAQPDAWLDEPGHEAGAAEMSVWQLRAALGEALGMLEGPDVDGVVAADVGAQPAAVGFAAALDKPLLPALLGPGHAASDLVGGRRIALVATAASEILRGPVGALVAARAEAVHVRATAPRRVRGCAYGVEGVEVAVDQPEHAFAARLGATSAAWLAPGRVAEVLHGLGASSAMCMGCLGAPWPLEPELPTDQLPLFQDPSTPNREG